MSQSDTTTPQSIDQQNVDTVLTVLRTASETALGTEAVADRTGLPTAVVDDALDRLERRGAVAKVDLEGEYVGWEAGRQVITSRADGDSFVVRDETTGVTTRDRSRAAALSRLADRLAEFEAGDSLGAQVLGIAETVISPGYVDGLDDLRESFVGPEYITLWVYTEEDGVVRIDEEQELNRPGTVEGIAITATLDEETFDRLMVADTETVAERSPITAEMYPLGVFKVVAVPPRSQGKGIGTSLTSHAMAHLAQNPPVVTMLWDRDQDGNEKLAAKFDGERLARFENALPFDEQCPECGFEGECDCAVELYAWGLDLVDA